ncbi:peptide chain release factor 1, mitochondrial isoform X2 [Microcaecilia unicolor]|uniref:Peptide chain release factor 1, mitochondrial isoform X2 n=1 Tax=Microcaecilia unicolor TaxID=1415580 RepID=A0A6P7Y0S3_9AMPH|nr:peptide chain release factor 1, mitochondrial isoform X2 [Microcaecilia unicolor]
MHCLKGSAEHKVIYFRKQVRQATKMKHLKCINIFKSLLANSCHLCHRYLYSFEKRGQITALAVFRKAYFLRAVRPCHKFQNQSQRCFHQDSGAPLKHKAVQKYLEAVTQEHGRISHVLSLSSVSEDERQAFGKRHAYLSPLVKVFQEIQQAEREAEELESMCADLDSREEGQLLDLVLEERKSINQVIYSLYRKLFQILVPQDKYDDRDVLLEVTSGRTTGGDICQQFTKEMFEMYQGYAHYRSWTFEILNYTTSEYGGLHHAAARVSGESVYKRLKFEGGTHRVQRIPEVGLSSRMQRIHTGTMTVIVLPQPDEVEIKLDPKDLCIDTCRAKGAGGQHVNTTDSAVRIVHIPTGTAVECQQERSQLMNREKAIKMLRAKLYEHSLERELSHRKSARKLQVGTRAQSERIRTYNFTQDRITDHRISYEVRNIKEFLCGERLLDELIDHLLKLADTEMILEFIENNINAEKQLI